MMFKLLDAKTQLNKIFNTKVDKNDAMQGKKKKKTIF
jgi:hypothetical protein